MKIRQFLIAGLLVFASHQLLGMGEVVQASEGRTEAQFQVEFAARVNAIRTLEQDKSACVRTLKERRLLISLGSAVTVGVAAFGASHWLGGMNSMLRFPSILNLTMGLFSGCCFFCIMHLSKCFGIMKYCSSCHQEIARLKNVINGREWLRDQLIIDQLNQDVREIAALQEVERQLRAHEQEARAEVGRLQERVRRAEDEQRRLNPLISDLRRINRDFIRNVTALQLAGPQVAPE